MSEAKRQHFVPRFYLKRFAQNGKRIFAFDKTQQKSFPTTVKTIASKNRFYDWTQERVDQLLVDLKERRAAADTCAGRFAHPFVNERHYCLFRPICFPLSLQP